MLAGVRACVDAEVGGSIEETRIGRIEGKGANVRIARRQARQAVVVLETPLQRQITQAQAAANRDQQIIAGNPASSPRATAARTDAALVSPDCNAV